MIRVNNMIYVMAASYLSKRNFHQFTDGDDEVVLFFQLAAENIICCGNLNVILWLTSIYIDWLCLGE